MLSAATSASVSIVDPLAIVCVDMVEHALDAAAVGRIDLPAVGRGTGDRLRSVVGGELRQHLHQPQQAGRREDRRESLR